MIRPALVALLLAPALVHAQTSAQLRLACKQFIERQLHDPSRAKLEWTEGRTSKNKQGLHIVQIRGRAPNAMGAVVLGTFECTIRQNGQDDFNLVNLRVF